MCFNKPCQVPPPHVRALGEQAAPAAVGHGSHSGHAGPPATAPAPPRHCSPSSFFIHPELTVLGTGCWEQSEPGQLHGESPIDYS